MAIVGTVAGGHESKWGFVAEATFGGAADDTANYTEFCGPIPSVDSGLFRDNTVKGGDGRMRDAANDFVGDEGGLRVISFSDLIVRLRDLPDLLYLVCQNVSEAVGTPFEKTYTLSTSTTQPNFAADAGYFCQIGIFDTIAAYHRNFRSCILRTLTLSADLSGDGMLRASGEFISGFTQSTAETMTGSWAGNAHNLFNFNKPTAKKIGGNDIVLFGFDLTINNNAVRVGSDSNGDAETYALATTETGYDISGNMKVKYDTSVQGLIAGDIAGTATAIQLATGVDGASGNFDATFSSTFLQNVQRDYGDARGQAIDVPFIVNSPAVFTVSDAIDRTW
jgi:hypothetical protein